MIDNRMLLTLYLGAGSHVDEHGKAYMDPRQVADLALNAIRKDARGGNDEDTGSGG